MISRPTDNLLSNRLLLIVGTLIFGALLAITVSIFSAEIRQVHADFKWFGTLGFSDVKGSPFVRVATGQWSQRGDDGPQNQYLSAFLLSSNATSFKVLTLDLSTLILTNSRPGTAEHERVGFEVLNLHREVEQRLKQLRSPPGKEDFWKRFGAQMPEQTEIFVLSWGCWRNGRESDALNLYREASKLPRDTASPANKGTLKERALLLVDTFKAWLQKLAQKNTPFREKLEKSIAHKLMWAGVLNSGDPSVSRPELLRQFDTIVRDYPHSEHLDRARKTAEVLRRMIAEDRAHGPVRQLSGLSTNDQVAELIFQLREQNGHQYSQPGSCDIFEDWHGATNTPAHRLVALQYAAVPQLISSLDSDAFSRSVGYHRNFYFSHTVLTVGDCAEAILERITGRSFAVVNSGPASVSTEAYASARRIAAEAWWKEFQGKGEQQMLVQGVVAAGNDAAEQAELLRQHFPDVAPSAILEGARAATNSWIRTRLIEQLAKIEATAAVAFLRVEVTNGPTIQSRVAAAYGLRSYDNTAAITAMVREWQRFGTIEVSSAGDDEGPDDLIGFLATCDSLEAIGALDDRLDRRPVAVRLQVIDALGETNHWTPGGNVETSSPATAEAVEDCLVKALEDMEERTGLSGSRNGKDFSHPRICDMACNYLAERWPDRYAFDLSGPRKAREVQRIQCLNSWRKAHNLSLVPLPRSQREHVSAGDCVKVTSVEWATNSAQPGKDLAAKIDHLKNRRLNPGDVVSLLSYFADRPEPNSSGIEMRLEKDGDLTGVGLFIRLIPGVAPQTSDWGVNMLVILGHKNLHDSAGQGTISAYTKPEQWQDFADAIEQAVVGSPETPFEISASIRASKPAQMPMPPVR
jgi:hypothetical protein